MSISSSRCDAPRRLARLALGLCAPLGAALAQPAAPTSTLERVIVTGSQIPRVDGETALPVQIIRRDEIQRSGVASVAELLARVSANLNGATDAWVGTNAPGFSGASLRGFGSRATLVLLNGRRVANHAFSANDGIGVDLHVIPLAAVERVEILKDGASAIYGSDAIAGVVNFILRSDYRGAEVGLERQRAEAGGGGRDQQTVTLGFGDALRDGFNVFAVVDHRRERALRAVDRPFAATGYRPDVGLTQISASGFPANVQVGPGAFVNPAAPACTARTVFFLGGCFYDFVPDTDLLPPSDNLALLTRATWALPEAASLFAELLWSRQRTRYVVAPTPVNRFGLVGNQPIVVPETSPFYPAGLGLTGDIVGLFYRAAPLGPRITDVRSVHQRALLGWRGVVAGWDADAAVMQSTSRATSDFASGMLDTTRLTDAFATGLINPFGDSGPAGNALLASTEIRGRARESRGTTRSVDLRASRDIARWSAGPLTLGFGGEARTESLEDRSTALNDQVTGNTFRATPKAGRRQAQALYVELGLPIVRTLDAQLALRADHYSDFGTSVSPKAAVRWQPSETLLFRASAGTGFRAPTLPELYAAQGRDLVPLGAPDPKRCPVTGLESDCSLEVLLVGGGNPSLRAERSRQASLGLVFEPAANTSIGIDWWQLTLEHTIGIVFPDQSLSGDDRYEGKNIVRGPIDPAFPGLPGPITSLLLINENLGRQRASGIDIDVRHRTAPGPLGRFGVRLAGSYLLDWRISYDGVTDQRLLGSYDGHSYPRWQHTLTFDWDRKPWAATLGQTWRAGYTDHNAGPLAATPRRVGPYQTWDAQLAYSGVADLTLAVGVRNLFDRAPPFSNQTVDFQVGYDPTYADPRGRVWYLRANHRFR